MPDLDALIARLEAANDPDRELDIEVARLVGWKPSHGKTGGEALFYPPGGRLPKAVPEWTKSIDAAAELLNDVSANRATIGFGLGDDTRHWAEVGVFSCDQAATPAIALLIAILKARKAAG